jgi:hypothetical protein
MSLTGEESRGRAAIDRELSHESPELDRALTEGRLPHYRVWRAAEWALLAAVLTLAVGVAIQNGPVCAAGWLGLLASGLMLCVGRGFGQAMGPARRAGAR